MESFTVHKAKTADLWNTLDFTQANENLDSASVVITVVWVQLMTIALVNYRFYLQHDIANMHKLEERYNKWRIKFSDAFMFQKECICHLFCSNVHCLFKTLSWFLLTVKFCYLPLVESNTT